jgi:hypothetical protein
MDEVQKPTNSECYTPLPKPFRIYNYTAFTKKLLDFSIVLTYSDMRKQTRKSGRASAIKRTFSKKCNSRTQEVAVRKVLQEDWTFHRASKYYKVP